MRVNGLMRTAGLASLMLAACASVAPAKSGPQTPAGVQALLRSSSALSTPTGVPRNKGPEVGTSLPGAEPGVSAEAGHGPRAPTVVRYRYRCLPQWFWITNVPAGFVIGECKQNWVIDGQVAARGFHNTPWGGGRVGGNFDGCGWINARLNFIIKWLNQRTRATACRSPSRGFADFILQQAPGKYFVWSHPTKREDGKPAPNARPCPAYQNYRPWTSLAKPANATHVIPANAKMADGVTDRIRVRYVTKYPSTDGSGYYFMARDLALQSGQGNWVFIPINCIL